MKTIRIAAVLIIASVAVFAATEASAQQLNQRKKAPPKAESGIERVVARAELQSRQETGGTLRDERLTVSKSCGTLQVGGSPAAADQPRPDSLVGKNTLRDQESTTVAKNIVNICR